MKISISNLQIRSNIYPVIVRKDRIDLTANLRFCSRITDRKALRRLVDIVQPGMNYDEQRVRCAQKIPGLSEWQIKRIITPDECSHPLAPRGGKPWGVSILNGELKFVCKCDFISCPLFCKCRPEEVTNAPKD